MSDEQKRVSWRGPLRVLLMGTPDFAVPALELLASWETLDEEGLRPLELVGVVSQPDRPKGRGQRLQRTPTAAAADRLGCPVFQWPRLNNESFDTLQALRPDLSVVIAYGKILPKRYLDLPTLGCWNLHGSLLPGLRGAAPVQWALINGERETGVSLMQLDEGMDTGPVALERRTQIQPEEDAGALMGRLSFLAAEVLREGLAALWGAGLTFQAQDEAAATYAPLLKKADGHLDWGAEARALADRVRGLSPWPGAWCESPRERLKVHKVRVVEGDGEPGQVLEPLPEGPRVACGAGALCLIELQRAGRRAQSGAEFLRGASLTPGEVLQ